MEAIHQRLKAHAKSEKNIMYTEDHMRQRFKARLYKPQRLLSISLEEEEKRALAGWWSFDEALRIAVFDDKEVLQDFVPDPEAFREQVRDLVIFMSDQVPMWLKISPGKQLYAEHEVGQKAGGSSGHIHQTSERQAPHSLPKTTRHRCPLEST